MKKSVKLNINRIKTLTAVLIVAFLVFGIIAVIPNSGETVFAAGRGAYPPGLEKKIEARDSHGNLVDIASVDKSTYNGFVFRITEDAPARYRIGMYNKFFHSKIVRVYGDFFCADSLADIAKFIDVRYIDVIEPDYLVELEETVNDPYYNSKLQWNLKTMNVEGAWEQGLYGKDISESENPVRVAIIDSGLYEGHEDIDYSNVLEGIDYTGSETGTPDDMGHGTFVAGTIAAALNNNKGIAGITPDVEILPLKVFANGSKNGMSVVARAINDAIEKDCDVINMSLGVDTPSITLQDACDRAETAGLILVGSAGNDGNDQPNYPASCSNVVGVGSVNEDENYSSFSQYGGSTDVAAPGSNLYGLSNNSQSLYKYATGTSVAAPEVTALAAVAKSLKPEINQSGFVEVLRDTCRDKGDEGFDPHYGWGIVDFGAAAEALINEVDYDEYKIDFDVTDTDGNRLSDADMTVTDSDGNTVSPSLLTGRYTLQKGEYSYTAGCEGYTSVSGSIKPFRSIETVHVQLEKTYDIEFNIADSSGQKIPGAAISYTQINGNISGEEISGMDGTYRCSLPSGKYSYSVSAEGFEDKQGVFTVNGADGMCNTVLYKSEQLCTASFRFHNITVSTLAVSGVDMELTGEDGASYAAGADGKYLLPKNSTFTYKLTKTNYIETRGTITTDGSDSAEFDLGIESVKSAVTFKVQNEAGNELTDADITVMKGDQVMSPTNVDMNTYNLPSEKNTYANYTYSVSCSGYNTEVGKFTVYTTKYMTIKVTLTKNTVRKGIIIYDDNTDEELTSARLSVWNSSDELIRPDEEGMYSLMSGGKYTYSASCSEYASASGTFTCDDETGDDIRIGLKEGSPSAGEGDFAGGNGSKADPYLIENEDQLRLVGNDLTADYRLVSDVEMTGNYVPAGTEQEPFTGIFDGAGHTISGIEISGGSDVGLFGVVRGGMIRNVIIGDGSIAGDANVGAIAGRVIYDDIYDTRIENCGNRASVSGNVNFGGIAGYVQATGSHMTNIYIQSCFNSGSISAAGSVEEQTRDNYEGGIVGYAAALDISSCYNTGDVTGQRFLAGIAGNMAINTVIRNSYNAGDITTNFGYDQKAGAIAGVTAGKIVDCFMRDVTGLKLVGDQFNYNSYPTTTGVPAAKTEEEMKAREFLGLLNIRDSAADNAFAYKTDSYPLLSWQPEAMPELQAEKPVITQNLHNMEYRKGDSDIEPLTVTVQRPNEGTLTYQWYRSDTTDSGSAVKISGASGITEGTEIQYVPEITEHGRTYYYVVITNTVTKGKNTAAASIRSDMCIVNVLRSQQEEAESQERIDRVSGLIAGLGAVSDLRLEDKPAVQNARTEYEKLEEDEKGRVANYSELKAAEAKIAALEEAAARQARIDNVVDRIEAIGAIDDLTLDDKQAVAAARAAYNKLAADEQKDVTNYSTLQEAETKIAALEEAAARQARIDEVVDRIAAIGAVDDLTLDNKQAVVAARAAYNKLAADEQRDVTNYSILQEAEAKIAALEEAAARQARIDGVISKIALISKTSSLTLNDESKVTAARTAYESLAPDEQADVTNYDALQAAEARIEELKAEQPLTFAEVQALFNQIAAKSEITLADKPIVQRARNGYEQLSKKEQNQLKKRLNVLSNAEAKIAELEKAAEEAAARKARIDKVVDRIAALGKIDDLTLADKDAIEAARAAYDKLAADEQRDVTNYAELQAAETKIAALEEAVARQARIDSVVDRIAAIGVIDDLTLADKAAVEAARAAYDKLAADEQREVENYSKLQEAEAKIAALEEAAARQARIDKVDDCIAALGKIDELTLEDKDAVEAARAAYDKLAADEQREVANYSELQAAEAKIVELEEKAAEEAAARKARIDKVADRIAAIGAIDELTLEDKAAVEAARAAYDKLAADERDEVANYSTLQAAEAKIAELEKAAAEAAARQARIDSVVDCIASLGKIDDLTLEDKAAVEAARAAYDKLAADERDEVANYEELQAAEAKIAELEKAAAEAAARQARIDKVADCIAAIGEIDELTLADKAAVEAARAAYDKLAADERDEVANYAVLQAAEAKIAELEKAAEEAAARRARIDKVADCIAAIGEIDELTLADKAAVEAARAAYDKLAADEQREVANYAVLQAAEAKIAELEKAAEEAAAEEAARKARIDKVADRIAAIGKIDELTLEDKAAVEAARAAYDKLAADERDEVTNYSVLQEAEAKIAELEKAAAEAAARQARIDKVAELISGLGSSDDLTLADKAAVEAARAAYDKLAADERDEVANYSELQAAEAKIAELEKAAEEAAARQARIDKVADCIAAIGEIDELTLADKAAVEAARAAYDKLAADERDEVANYSELQAAEAKIAELEKAAEEAAAEAAARKARIDKVVELISGLGSSDDLTLADKAAVEAARAAYDKLAADEQGEVANYAVLQAAEAKIAELEKAAEEAEAEAAARQERINNVVKLIEAIGDIEKITLDNFSDIAFARAAYEALTEDEQSEITNYSALEAAETKLEELEKEAGEAAARQARIDNVVKLIEAIGDIEEITLDNSDNVAFAKAAYEALTEDEQSEITNYSALEAAEAKIEELEKAAEEAETEAAEKQARIDNVVDCIAAIGEIDELTLADKDAVEAARAAYDKLTADEQARIDQVALDRLNKSEEKLRQLSIPDKPVLVVDSKTYNTVNISWTANAKADGYYVYRALTKTGGYKMIRKVIGGDVTHFKHTRLKTGKRYYYKVKAYCNYRYNGSTKLLVSAYSNRVTAKPSLTKPQIKTITPGVGKIKITWNKVSGAKGYVVYRATSKTGKYIKVKTLKKRKTVKFTNKQLKSGKKYYYKVRAYRIVNSKRVYSRYSKIRTARAQ